MRLVGGGGHARVCSGVIERGLAERGVAVVGTSAGAVVLVVRNPGIGEEIDDSSLARGRLGRAAIVSVGIDLFSFARETQCRVRAAWRWRKDILIRDDSPLSLCATKLWL